MLCRYDHTATAKLCAGMPAGLGVSARAWGHAELTVTLHIQLQARLCMGALVDGFGTCPARTVRMWGNPGHSTQALAGGDSKAPAWSIVDRILCVLPVQGE